MQIVFIGPAGSGKTTLVSRYGEWLGSSGRKVSFINLDPGAEEVPYSPSFDIRDFFTVEEIMRKERLGPNGAMIRAMDILAEKSNELTSEIESFQADYRLVDTPGQSELFVFRTTGPEIVRSLSKIGRTLIVFLIDGHLIRYPSDLIAMFSLAAACKLRLNVPLIHVVTKSDKLGRIDLELLMQNSDYLKERIVEEEGGLLQEYMLEYSRIIHPMLRRQRTIFVSALARIGFEELESIVHDAICECGDLR
ncbi:MAG: ATP/GTP-binding protein [Nitrososphaerota archaeon]|nr:ATP/GTP-binding protein [Nitrososphaerota archaeon]